MSRHLGWSIVRLILTAGILTYLLRDLDWTAAGTALAAFSAESIEAFLVLIAADRLLMFARWVLLVRTSTNLPIDALARIFFVSSFVGSFLPAGVGGDAARAFSVSRRTRQPDAAVAGVVVDRLLGLQAVAVAGCVGVLWAPALVPHALRELTLGVSLVLMLGTVAALYADRLAIAIVPARWHAAAVGAAILRLSAALAAYRGHARTLWTVAALSLVVQAVRVLLAWVIGLGLGITLPMSYYWVFMPLNILVTLLPLSVGGFGVPQGTMVWSLAPLGVSATPAFLLSMLFTVAGTIGNLPGAVLYVIGRTRVARRT